MKKTNYNTRIFSAILFFLVSCAIIFWFFRKPILRNLFYFPRQAKQYLTQKPEPWMTVFVHGNFGSLLSLLSLRNVLKDKVSGSLYRKVTKAMRKDEFFFREQPILQRGLIRIEPSFDIETVGNKKYAAYPITKAYKTVLEAVRPGKEQNFFYTFGWSGLMSLNSRRFEAIRLYNSLSQELKKFHKQGIYPQIRILAHSHGGNLCLNLAAVNKVLQLSSWDGSKIFSHDPDEKESIQGMMKILQELTTKENAKLKRDQKKYDYVPKYKNLIIDELLIFGTPIQPETECFCYSSTFKKVYNFYSGEDVIQKLDWVSSKKPFSSQRFSKLLAGTSTSQADKVSKIVQIRVMTEKPVANDEETLLTQDGSNKVVQNNVNNKEKNTSSQQEPSIWRELFGGRNIFVRQSKDPTHKELWFMGWKTEDSKFTSFLNPLPVVIFAPLIVEVLNKLNEINDAELNIRATSKKVKVYVTKRGTANIRNKGEIDRSLIEEIKEKVKSWKPIKTSQFEEFHMTYKYLL